MRGDTVVPFLEKSREWDGALVSGEHTFVTAIGAGTSIRITSQRLS